MKAHDKIAAKILGFIPGRFGIFKLGGRPPVAGVIQTFELTRTRGIADDYSYYLLTNDSEYCGNACPKEMHKTLHTEYSWQLTGKAVAACEPIDQLTLIRWCTDDEVYKAQFDEDGYQRKQPLKHIDPDGRYLEPVKCDTETATLEFPAPLLSVHGRRLLLL